MKLTFDSRQLADAVAWTARYAKPTTPVPILSGLLFQPMPPDVDCDTGQPNAAGAANWTVTGYDYDHCATAALEPYVYDGEPERFVLHGRWLATLLGKLGKGDVQLVVDDGVATITSGRGRWTMPCMAAGEYPELPTDPPCIGSVPAADLRGALERVSYAVGDDGVGLPELTMVCLGAADGQLELVSSDRFRVARAYLSWFAGDVEPFLVDADVVRQMLPDSSTDATLLFDPKTQLHGVACGNRVLVSRGMDAGKFPPVGKFFETPLTGVVAVNRAELLQVLDQATVCGEPKTKVLLAFDSEQRSLTLETQDAEMSTASSVEIDATANYTGHSAMRAGYLRDVLKVLDTEYVQIGLVSIEGAIKPVQLTGAEDDDVSEWVPDTTHQHLLVPVRYQ